MTLRTVILSEETMGTEDVTVSTVSLRGIPHGRNTKGLALIYETMIFGGDLDEYQERYATKKEAEVGHERAVKRVKKT